VESLTPPCVPERPSSEWWNAAVVAAAKKSSARAEVYSAVVTGRIEKFRPRVLQLLQQAGLDFSSVHLKSGNRDTALAKKGVFQELIEALPGLERVAIWEDRSEHVATFKDFFTSKGFDAEVTLVKATPMPAQCAALGEGQAAKQGKKVLYVALILDEASRQAAQDWFVEEAGVALLPTVITHHVTLQFKPSEEQLAQLAVGSRAAVRAVGWAADASAQAVVVSGVEAYSGIPHVTVATATGVPPAYSKTLLQAGFTRAAGPKLTGTIEAVTGK
jgi:hypothetical protein